MNGQSFLRRPGPTKGCWTDDDDDEVVTFRLFSPWIMQCFDKICSYSFVSVEALKWLKLLYIICCFFAALVLTCLGLASLAILYEAIKVYLAHVKYKRVLRDEDCHSSRCTNERSSLLGNGGKSHISYSHKYVSF